MSRFIHPLVAYARSAGPGATTPRLVLGLALGAALIFGLVHLTGIGLDALFGGLAEGAAPRAASPIGVLMVLAGFFAVWPALWLLLPVVHGRSARTLFGPEQRLNWRHVRLGMAVSLFFGIAAWAPLLVEHGGAIDALPDLRVWAIYAAIAAPLIFVQVAAEELVFRGYLLQQFAARSLSVLGWSVLPSLVFAYAHPTGEGLGGLSWFHFVFGLIMAAVTSRTANLGAAIGLHFGHNLVNVLLIAPAHLISGLALFPVPESVDTYGPRITYLVVMFIGAALFMGFMDLRFIRAWRAQKRADLAARQTDGEDRAVAAARAMAAE